MAKYRVDTDKGSYMVETEDSPPVPGMEKLGGTPPPPAKPPLPDPRGPSISIPLSGQNGAPKGLDRPMTTGEEVATSPLKLFAGGAEQAGRGMSRMAQPESGSDFAGGVSDTARGIGTLALPFAAPAMAAALVRAAVGMGTGLAVGGGTEAGLKAVGVPEGYSELAGTITGAAAGVAAGRYKPGLASRDPKLSMVKAMKPTATNTGFKNSLSRSLPELKATESATGKPITSLAELMEAIDVAKKRVWQQYRDIAEQPAIDPYSNRPTVGTRANAQHDMSPVAEAMEATVSPKLIRENPRAVQAIKNLASKYRTPMTLQEAESILKTTNAELDGYYAKYPTGQRKALAANPQVAVKEAQASALRDTIYNALDDAGEGSAPREFKQRYGALMNLEREGYHRMNVAERQQPDSLSQQAGKWVGMGHVVKGLVTRNPADVAMGIAESQAATWLKNQQTTDALIKSALDTYKGTPAPVTSPAPFRPKALLTQGDIITPPPEDTSFVRSAPAMTAPPGQKALPPASTIITPPPEASGPHPSTSPSPLVAPRGPMQGAKPAPPPQQNVSGNLASRMGKAIWEATQAGLQ